MQKVMFLTIWVIALIPAIAATPELWYKQPAKDWSEALPIGNGKLAGMVFGGVEQERIQLNEESIYAGKAMNRINPKAKQTLPKVRRLLLDGKTFEAEALAESDLLAIPSRQPPYQPFGNLVLQFEKSAAAPEHYRRSLNLFNGTLNIEYDADSVHFRREAFASYPDQAIVLHMTASKKGALSFSVALDRETGAKSSVDSAFGESTVVLRGQASPPRDKFPDEPQTGARFTGAVRVLAKDGSVTKSGDGLAVKAATAVTLVFTAATDARGDDPNRQCKQQLQSAIAHTPAQLLSRHKQDFNAIATRTQLTLTGDDAAIEALPTDERLVRIGKDKEDRGLLALYFQYGRYLLQSSSRQNSLAANLQGKWNKDLSPSWGSKYTVNINTEMNYWPAETCNLAETVDGLHNLLDLTKPSGERTATQMYKTGGLVIHHNTDGWGDTEPIDSPRSGMWPFGAAWLSLALWDHYDFSRDKAYLRERAYPLLREAALFALNNLFDDGHGHLVSGPSISPENRFFAANRKPAYLDYSPTMDIEITNALFRRVIEASTILKTDADLRQKLSNAMTKLLPLQIGKYGQLQEWRQDYDETEIGHRHLSHLFALYPSNEITKSTPKLYDAVRASLERRLEHGGGGTGWSRAWVVCLWARFREGDKASDSLKVLLTKSTWPNLFDLHPPNIFQIDGNLGATAGISEMLLQSQNGVLDLLPALPNAWKDGEVRGLRARGGITVDLTWRERRIQSVTLQAMHAGAFKIHAGPGTQSVSLKKGETRTLQF